MVTPATITINSFSDQLHKILQEKFHFKAFRPGQLEAINTLMTQGRLLCIQPTGHGKSLLYQLPAVLLPGITIVVSPLLALMRDQIDQLNNRFHISAASINSDQAPEENYKAQQLAAQGKIKILFVAPEKLDHLDYFNFLLDLPVNFIVVDEAHCVSTWGHDFRPSYRQIIHFIRAVEQKNSALKVLAITATANQKTEEDIKNQLAQSKNQVLTQRQNMDRANIQLSVIQLTGLAEKLYTILQLINQLEGCGLIYCATRENTELTAEYLQSQSINAVAYHAGLDPITKRQLQHNFIANQYKVIAATNALGMGIDKQDLRFIIHFDTPGSITAYYQEVGRCGRDGQLAQGILLFDEADKKIQDYFINSSQPTITNFQQILQGIKTAETAPDLTTIKRMAGFHPNLVNVVVSELIEQGFIAKRSTHGKQLYFSAEKNSTPNLSRYENQFQTRTFELKQMIYYSQQRSGCLMQLLRKALGDTTATVCKHCNVCSKSHLVRKFDPSAIAKIQNWLNFRASMISPSIKNHLAEGVAVLNAQLRAPVFVEFMKSRSTAASITNPELLALIKQYLLKLKNQHSFSVVVPIPSRTWVARNPFAQWVADLLQVKLLVDYLQWQKIPASRQGELLNNDQRRYNVAQHMQCNKQIIIPAGSILLIDDYVGSGATLQEAARVLSKEANLSNDIVPFTIAMVKWHLGKRGMVFA